MDFNCTKFEFTENGKKMHYNSIYWIEIEMDFIFTEFEFTEIKLKCTYSSTFELSEIKLKMELNFYIWIYGNQIWEINQINWMRIQVSEEAFFWFCLTSGKQIHFQSNEYLLFYVSGFYIITDIHVENRNYIHSFEIFYQSTVCIMMRLVVLGGEQLSR